MNSPGFAFKIAVSTALQPHNASPIHRSLSGVDHKPALRAGRDRKAARTPEITRRKQNEGTDPRGTGRMRIRVKEVRRRWGHRGASCRAEAGPAWGPGLGRETHRVQDEDRAGPGGGAGHSVRALLQGLQGHPQPRLGALQLLLPQGGWPMGGLHRPGGSVGGTPMSCNRTCNSRARRDSLHEVPASL